jgi:hypothetical protein
MIGGPAVQQAFVLLASFDTPPTSYAAMPNPKAVKSDQPL